MFRRYLLLTVFLLSALNSALSQINKTKTIKWPKYYKAKIPDASTSVASIKVIPVLWDAGRLGYVQVGLDNKNVSAVPEEPSDRFIQDYITKQYGDDFKSGGLHLLWIVKDLRINERTLFSSEYAFVRLRADAYASAEGNTYRLVTAFDTVLRHGGLEATGWHGQNMAQAFHLLLKQTLEQTPAAMADASAVTFTVAQIETQEEQRFALPVLTASAYKEGVYTSFNEFLQNNPSIDNFEAITEDKKVRLYSVAGVYRSRIDKPWGVCTDGELYKYEAGELIPVERLGNGFLISTYLENTNRRNKNMFTAALVGGAVGGVLGSVAGSAASAAGGLRVPGRFIPLRLYLTLPKNSRKPVP